MVRDHSRLKTWKYHVGHFLQENQVNFHDKIFQFLVDHVFHFVK